MQLEDNVAIVTGGGSGIGRASALALARSGAKVIVADLDGDRASTVADEIIAEDGAAVGVAGDVSEDGTHEDLRDLALAAFGQIDVVMNNVGVIAIGQPEVIPLAEWQRVMDINLGSMLRSNAVFVPHLLAQGHGHLVYTSSSEGLFRAEWNLSPYSTTKSAVTALADAMWLYLSPKGIGVTCLFPGPVLTNIVEQIRVFGDPGPMTGPDLPLIEPEVVGDQVVAAIQAGRFAQYTHPQLCDLSAKAAADREAFLASQLPRIGTGRTM